MINTFKRYERKFMIDEKKMKQLKEKLAPYFVPDDYCVQGPYQVSNVYFDTEDARMIRHSISKPYYKEKLRLRSYGHKKDIVFLELKKKINGIVSKRRVSLTPAEADRFLSHNILPTHSDYMKRQVLAEISRSMSAQAVRPAVFISYERMAYFCRSDKRLRITFDTNIMTRRDDLSVHSQKPGRRLIPTGTYLMEIKFIGSVPLWLAGILSELGIYSTGFSKYGTEYTRMALEQPEALEIAK